MPTPDRIIQDFRYRPDVDGLRAVAVLAVVFYHAGVGLPGGFVGVDVFFVISGFLITSLIVKDLQEGKFTLANFWERRARRILPALTLVVLATLIAGWFLLLPRDYAALGKSAAFQSVFGANFHFYRATMGGYFAGSADEMPLLHTWSLAVEEQFYLIFPLALAAIFRFPRLRSRRVLLGFFGAGMLVSFLASLYGVEHFRIATFYLLPTRAWELLLGSALAVFPLSWMTKHRPTREILSFVGLASILVPCLFYSGKTPFPGLAALPPCLGAALIIWSNSPSGHAAAPTSLSRLLSIRPVVFVGLISYSLYLWHWPLFAFSRYYWAEEPLTLTYRVALIAISFGLAILAWRFVETPFRRKVVCAQRKSLFRFAATALVTLFTLSASIVALHGLPQRLPNDVRDYLSEAPQEQYYAFTEIEDLIAGKLAPFGVRDPANPVEVLVWGDSHANSALPAFDAVLKAKGISGRAASHAGFPPVLGFFYETEWGFGKNAPPYNAEVMSYIEKNRIPHVVLISRWNVYNESNSTGSLESALLTTVNKLVSLGTQPWIFLDVPGAGCDVGKLYRRAVLLDLNERRFCTAPGPWNGIIGTDPLLLDRLQNAGARIIDPRPAFLNSSKDLYLNALDGVILYRDDNHLTTAGAEKVLVPVLEKSFLPHLTPSVSSK